MAEDNVKKEEDGACSHFSQGNRMHEQEVIRKRMGAIKRKILVLSGKGGVGKSTIAANLAMSLSLAGKKTGILDIDIHGPSIPMLFGVTGGSVAGSDEDLLPVEVEGGLKVMSIGFFLQSERDAVIWRGPMKYNMIKQFLMVTDWGELDFLVVDSPPGTGDEPLAVVQLIGKVDGAVIVTTPQDIALSDVSKCISFCRTLKIPITGIIENMSGFICPHCHEEVDIFKKGGGQTLAEKMGVPFLGKIPVEPEVVRSSDSGMPYVFHHSHSEIAKAFGRVVLPIIKMESSLPDETNLEEMIGSDLLRIAIPVSGERLSMHFGHCDTFALLDVDPGKKEILNKENVDAPPHQPGLLPRWLHERGVNMIIAGGMGTRAQELFAQNNIKVITGAPNLTPERLIKDLLEGSLVTGANICDH